MSARTSTTAGGGGAEPPSAAAEDEDSSAAAATELLRNEIAELKRQLSALRVENHELRQQRLDGSSSRADGPPPAPQVSPSPLPPTSSPSLPTPSSEPPSRYSSLSNAHIERYSRQILAGLGVEGQHKLLQAKVVVIGAGGIGSSCLLYLAGAGIGQLDIIDNDAVEASNLHRQIIHSTERCGMAKAVSAQLAVRQLSPMIKCEAIVATLTHDNAMQLLETYDVIVDATDNPLTRYLINDAATLLSQQKRGRVSVVFASAVATEAQITVFKHGTNSTDDKSSDGGGCYRCLYPDPMGSVASNCASCSDAGVLGPVPGLVGVLQATEVIKLLTGIGTPLTQHIVQYDALSCRFLRLRKPSRRPDCASCGSFESATRKIRSMHDSYESLRSVRGPSASVIAPCPIAPAAVQSVSPRGYYPLWRKQYEIGQLQEGSSSAHSHLLLDVREPIQYDLCHLPGSVNVPLRQLPNRLDEVLELAAQATGAGHANTHVEITGGISTGEALNIYCVCRRGIASAAAAALLAKRWDAASRLPPRGTSATEENNSTSSGDTRLANNCFPNVEIWNVRGGLDAWREQVDPCFPTY